MDSKDSNVPSLWRRTHPELIEIVSKTGYNQRSFRIVNNTDLEPETGSSRCDQAVRLLPAAYPSQAPGICFRQSCVQRRRGVRLSETISGGV